MANKVAKMTVEVDRSKAVEYIEGLDDAVRGLESACKMYCAWYDHGEPINMTPSAMSYELVTAIRIALAKLKGEGT